MGGVDHFFALAPSMRPSAPAKKSFSKANSPIFACMSFTLGPWDSRFSAGVRNTPIAPSSSCAFHCTIWLAWTSNFSDSSAKVLSPLSAASATFALYVAVWFLLGLFITAPLSGRLRRPSEQVLHLKTSPKFRDHFCRPRGATVRGAPDLSRLRSRVIRRKSTRRRNSQCRNSYTRSKRRARVAPVDPVGGFYDSPDLRVGRHGLCPAGCKRCACNAVVGDERACDRYARRRRPRYGAAAAGSSGHWAGQLV